MENQEDFNGLQPEPPVMVVNQQMGAYLFETARWAKLIAILGFIGAGLIALMALFAGTMLSTITALTGGAGIGAGMGMFISILYLLIALLVFLPSLFLFRFSVRAKAALLLTSESGLTDSLGNLKSYFKFNGILAIIVMVIYGLAIIVGIIGGIFAAAM